MHNGIYADLEGLIEFYNNAGGMGLEIPNSTLSEASLGLTDPKIDDIIAFMKSLESKMEDQLSPYCSSSI